MARSAAPSDAAPQAALSAPGRRVLRDLGRFGFLTTTQEARLAGTSLRVAQWGCAELHRRGWVESFLLPQSLGRLTVQRLTRKAQPAFAQADGPRRTSASLDRIDVLLGAVDLALDVQTRGSREWITWPEYCAADASAVRDARLRAAFRFPPVGVLREPDADPSTDGHLRPVWILLRRLPLASLREHLLATNRAMGVTRGFLYALPALCRDLQRAGIPAYVEAWTPPHLGGRAPFLPGWWREAERPGHLGVAALETLRHLDRFGHATGGQVARARGVHINNSLETLERLRAVGLTERHRARRGQPFAWSATAAGLAAAGSPHRPVPATPRHRRHSLALGDLAFELVERTGGRWETERELRAHPPDRHGRIPLAPADGRLTLPDGTRALVQLQLSPGPVSRHLYDARRFAVRGLCEQVWFVCTRLVLPLYGRQLRPADHDLVRVIEWTPPDHSGGMREPARGHAPSRR